MTHRVLPTGKGSWLKRSKRLRMFGSTSSLSRHPDDGWQNAEPYPMGGLARTSFRAVIRAICPPAPAPQLPDLVDRIELHVRSLMRYMHPLAARALWIAIFVLDWAPRFHFWSWHRLQGMAPGEGARFLTNLGTSRIQLFRTLLIGVRGAILSAYFDQDEVHRALGYTPRPFITDRMALRTKLLREPAGGQ
jgi:hypothetical protein